MLVAFPKHFKRLLVAFYSSSGNFKSGNEVIHCVFGHPWDYAYAVVVFYTFRLLAPSSPGQYPSPRDHFPHWKTHQQLKRKGRMKSSKMNEKIKVPLKRHHEVDLFSRARISRICMAAVAVNEAKKKTNQNLVTHRDVSPSLEGERKYTQQRKYNCNELNWSNFCFYQLNARVLFSYTCFIYSGIVKVLLTTRLKIDLTNRQKLAGRRSPTDAATGIPQRELPSYLIDSLSLFFIKFFIF